MKACQNLCFAWDMKVFAIFDVCPHGMGEIDLPQRYSNLFVVFVISTGRFSLLRGQQYSCVAMYVDRDFCVVWVLLILHTIHNVILGLLAKEVHFDNVPNSEL